MATMYIARVGTRAIGALPMFSLTGDPTTYLRCQTAADVDRMVERARETGFAVAAYTVEAIDVP